jgi:gliding motility-associated protein GldE
MFLSFCVSGAEVAFFSLSFKDINLLKSKTQPAYRRIVSMLEQPKVLQGALLIANIAANLAIVVIGNHFLDQLLPIAHAGALFAAKAGIMIVLVLLLCEILPKTMAAQNNIRFAKDVSWIVEMVFLVFGRVAGAFVQFSDSMEKRVGQRSASASLEELQHAIDHSTETDASQEEKNILKGIVKFGNITVRQVMRSRLDVTGVSWGLNFDELRTWLIEHNYSRLPVYEGSLDNIKGMIHTKDLLEHLDKDASFDWHSIIRKPYFVHEQKLIEDLLREFQQKRIHFAVVVDEFGGTSGIITMEDILEEVIGDINDEFDTEENINVRIDDMTFIFEGKTMLNDVCKMMHISPDTFDELKGESDSLAGLILEVAGEIPAAGSTINMGDFDFLIEEVQKNRIERVRVTIKTGTAPQ